MAFKVTVNIIQSFKVFSTLQSKSPGISIKRLPVAHTPRRRIPGELKTAHTLEAVRRRQTPHKLRKLLLPWLLYNWRNPGDWPVPGVNEARAPELAAPD
jgi:hypothetical protein